MLLNKWMYKLPKAFRVGITIVAFLLALLSFALLLAGIINDGQNQFALSFYHKKETAELNESYVKFLDILKTNSVDPKITDLFIQNVSPTINTIEYTQNSNALAWFVSTMILFFLLALIFSSSAALTSLKALKNTVNDCYRENYLSEWSYQTFNKIINNEIKNENKQKLENIKLYEKAIKEQIDINTNGSQ